MVADYGYGYGDSFDVALSDLTDFDWDKALVYGYPTSTTEIKEAIGVTYQGSMDMTYGIIFVKDNEIVYDERFPYNFEGMPPFFMSHNSDINAKPKYGIFSSDAVFTCTIYEKSNGTCLTLIPKAIAEPDQVKNEQNTSMVGSVSSIHYTAMPSFVDSETTTKLWISIDAHGTCLIKTTNYMDETLEQKEYTAGTETFLRILETIDQYGFFDLPERITSESTDGTMVYITINAANGSFKKGGLISSITPYTPDDEKQFIYCCEAIIGLAEIN